VLGLFLFLAVMWVTKNPQFVPGWDNFMEHKYADPPYVLVSCRC